MPTFDMAVYFTDELERIMASEGCSDEEKAEIQAELALRKDDPSREPVSPTDESPPTSRARTKIPSTTGDGS